MSEQKIGCVPDGYMPIPTAEQLAEALDNVRCFHDMSAELIAPELLANLLGAPTVKEPLSVPPSLPAAGSADLTAVRCQCCATEYPHDSYDAGFIAGSGMCQVCDAAMPPKDLPAAGSAELPEPDFTLDAGSQPCYYAETVQRIVAALSAQQSAPWAPSGADYDRAIHRNPDAKAWADFFIATFPGQADKHDLMLGWFANAMMAMHDHLKAQQSAHVSVPGEWLDAVKELFDAKQAKEDFERENPGNSTKRWDACLYRIEAAEDALRALLNGGEA